MSKRNAHKNSAAKRRRNRELRRSATGAGLNQQLLQAIDLAEDGQLEEARVRFEHLAASHPSNSEIWVLLANLCVRMQDFDAALKACRRLTELDPGNAEYQLMLGGLVIGIGRPALACRCFQRFLQLAPHDPRAEYARKTLHEAESYLRDFLRPHALSEAQFWEVAEQHEEILCELRVGRARRACELADRLIQRLPAFTSPWNNKSQALWMLGELPASRDCSLHVLAEHPDNFHSLSNLLHAQVLLGDDDAARATAERLNRITLDAEDLASRQAEALSFLGDDAGVVAIVEQFEQRRRPLNPADAAMWHFGAAAAARLGNEARARKWWKLAAKANPALEPARDNLRDLAEPELNRHGPWSFDLSQLMSRDFVDRFELDHCGKNNPDTLDRLRNYVAEHPYLSQLLRISLDRGDANSRQFLARLAVYGESAEMVDAIKEFVAGQRGTYRARVELATILVKEGHLPNGSLKLWDGTKWRETLLLGFEVYSGPHDRVYRPTVQELLEEAFDALQAQDGGKAEDLYRAALRLEPASPTIMNNLAMALSLQGRDRESTELQNLVFEQFPDYWFGKANRAHRLIEKGQLEEAQRLLEPMLDTRRLHISEFTALAAANANLLIEQGEREAAESWLAMWQNMDPEHPQLAYFRRKLQGSTKSLLNPRRSWPWTSRREEVS